MQLGFLVARGIRMVRPGEVATPEEIQQLREAFGGRAEIKIDQGEDGVVRSVSVQSRRLSDEADTVRTFIAPLTTEPTASGHRVD